MSRRGWNGRCRARRRNARPRVARVIACARIRGIINRALASAPGLALDSFFTYKGVPIPIADWWFRNDPILDQPIPTAIINQPTTRVTATEVAIAIHEAELRMKPRQFDI